MYLGVAYITHATQGIYSTFPFPSLSPYPRSCIRRFFRFTFPTFNSNIQKKNIPLKPVSLAYSFLNPTKQGPKLAAYIVGILVGYAIVFNLVRGVVVLRERWAVNNGHVLRVSSSGGPSASIDDDWEEVGSPVSATRAKEDA